MYKTGGGTFCPKTTVIDEKVVALLTPQFQPLPNEFDSSAPYYTLGKFSVSLIYKFIIKDFLKKKQVMF